MGLRLAIVITVFTALYGLLIGKLYDIQITKGQFYTVKAESQLKLAGLLEPPRGSIFFTDKQGSRIPAAMNKDYPFVFAVPKEIEDPKETAARISSVIGKPADSIEPGLSKKNSLYAPLLFKAPDEIAEAVKNAGIKGVYVDTQPARFYPLQTLGSQVLGFVSSPDGNGQTGQYGAERFFNATLTDHDGKLNGDVATQGEPGGDVHLTIDRNIEDRGSQIIKKLVSDYGASGGSFIVQDPKTGKILAMGGYPDFDPNSYGSYDIKSFMNPAVQEIYEPGSIVKVLTMSAGIDSGALTPDTVYYDSGSVKVNDRTIKNFDSKAYSKTTMTGVLEHSLNVGAVFAERRIGHKTFLSYLQKFGLGEPTGIDLPGELTGSLGPLLGKRANDVNFATAAFGQGISMTPLRLITAVSTVANGGLLMKPYVNADSKPQEIRRVISQGTAKTVTDMMVSAVDLNELAKIRGYKIAGKTGTAQVPNFNKGGYTDQVVNTYIGFAPASDPQFTVLIKLDKPAGAQLAGATIVPAFRELMEFILSYYNVSPDRISNN